MAFALPLQTISLPLFSPVDRSSHRFFVSFSSFTRSPFVFLSREAKSSVYEKFPRATEEGLPTELVEDSKFVPLNAEDPRYGPPALLLLGFEQEETAKIQQLIQELDGDFLKVIYCTEDMLIHSLWDAMNTEQSEIKTMKVAKSLPRICFLSGLTGEEMMMFIDAFPETGLEPAIFAALVPNSANKPLREVMEEILGDHEMLGSSTVFHVKLLGLVVAGVLISSLWLTLQYCKLFLPRRTLFSI